MRNFKGHIFFILLQCTLLFSSAMASDQHVILKAKTGNIILEGELLGYDSSHYKINSPLYGPMTVLIRKFSCIGEACPSKSDTEISKKKAQASKTKQVKFRISGSSLTGLRLVPGLLEQFSREQKRSFRRIPGPNDLEFKLKLGTRNKTSEVIIDINAKGSSSGFTSLIGEQAQIAMSSRPVRRHESKLATRTDQSNRLMPHNVALDAIVIIVSPRNQIKSLSRLQVAKIFSGEIKNWSEVGGTAGPINIYSRSKDTGIYESFNALALEPLHKGISGKAKTVRSSRILSETVASDPRGIGFTELAYAENAKALSISRSCGLKRAPSFFNIKTQEYPYTRKLYFYTSKNTTVPFAKKFIEYSLSERAQAVIRSTGFVNKSISSQSFDKIGDTILSTFSKLHEKNERLLLKLMVRTLRHANRLSVTFRFQPNSIRLDSTSIKDILKLGPVLQKANRTGKKVYLAGFSDSAGDFEQNREIALLRAQQVKNTLSNTLKGLIPSSLLTPVTFGELLPVACNTTPQGRAQNRRVEIWITK